MSSKKKRDLVNVSSIRSTPTSAASQSRNASSASSQKHGRKSNQSANESLHSSTDEILSLEGGDNVLELVRGYDLRAHLQQLMMFTGDDDEEVDEDHVDESDDYSLESLSDADDRDAELQQLALQGPDTAHPHTPLPTSSNNAPPLVPIDEEEDPIELGSDEENEIMREIRNEITNNVRQEMKSELELYQHKMNKLENSDGTPGKGSAGEGSGVGNVTSDLDALDPALKAAIIKMRKLDKILAKRVKKEREVKRDRILLERRIRREIEELHKTKKDEYKEVMNNEQKFLALELPQRHNEGVRVPDEFTGEEVFATQLNEDDYPCLGGRAPRQNRGAGRSQKRGGEGSGSEDGSGSRAGASSVTTDSTERQRGRKGKDFIKRNKELAADANNLIAMTEEEKRRLDDLLADMDTLPDIADNMHLDENNPFQIAVKPGDGFIPDEDELRSLTSIDSRLKELLPPEDYASIASSSLSHVPKNSLFTRTGVKHEVDWKSRGERALFQNAEQREMNERLQAIEMELAKLKNPDELELETPRLNPDQLHDLIDQCVTSLSMSRMTFTSESRSSFTDTESLISHNLDGSESTVDNTPRSPRSARQDLLDNPPHLAPEVLQKLLCEAYHPLSKQLSTLKEEEEGKDETPIPSEVWRLISMETGHGGPAGDSMDTLSLVSLSQSLIAGGGTNDTDRMFEPSNNNTDQILGIADQDMDRMLTAADLNENCETAMPEKLFSKSRNYASVENGLKSVSRTSSASSLTSVSDIGRESVEVREKEMLKLPEIDPTGMLVTQGLNNNKKQVNGHKTAVSFVRNSLSDSKMENGGGTDSRLELISLDGEMMSPHPPVEERHKGSGGKSRSASRSSVT
ncbi:uncharacterized protein LOC127873703 [Dreissena polymorpha]|uniref:Fibrous sheath-interacting protein 1 n=1 Tax=Dreissena polymorpha TaxID=45954 RepID=A0A9D4QYT6_DREPO|nr:uncharacterized protein LOC127873703 [Dreissena polymorpha]XP_052273613.1 uncharacterized protein LOC127873703 [Dreissena polymorpha]KAH3847817.1 hypothetical protein DPMN_090149 [Dreissena polymorpha]